MDRVLESESCSLTGRDMVRNDIPSYLRLHSEEDSDSQCSRPGQMPEYAQLFDAFQEATGWSLGFEPLPANDPWSGFPGADFVPSAGRAMSVCLNPSPPTTDSDQGPERRPVELYRARQLADAVAGLLAELQEARVEIWRREADLAAGVPVTPQKREEEHLAERLEAVLQGGAQAVGCQAAAVYLLDDATTELKLRAAWGLPRQRLLDAPRPLRGAVADLEALVGHAVVLEDTQILPHWKVPEPFASAVCVPIASPTEPLGTLWVFCEQTRDYTPEQTNLIEMIAGRVAAELQREILLRECVQTRGMDRQLRRAAEWQNDRLPCVAPLLDDWELAGWSHSDELLNNGFYDWFVPPDGSLALAVTSAEGPMLEAALTTAALHGAVRSHCGYRHDAAQMVNRVNETCWNSSAGGQFASLFYALIHPESGEIQCSCAGGIEAFVLRESGPEPLPLQFPPLGAQPDDIYGCHPFQI
ncbi:MAG: PP2C family protein-serine/threonine phosphatase, partial [Pirellulaceae bacterium]